MEIDWKCWEIWIFWLTTISNLFFGIKQGLTSLKKLQMKNLTQWSQNRLKNYHFRSSHWKSDAPKFSTCAFILDNVSKLNFSLFRIYSVLICSIKVSIKSHTIQQRDCIAQSYTSIFDLQFWFSDSSKTCYWYCKTLTFKLFVFRNYQPKTFHQAPTRNVPAIGAALS